MNDAGKKDTQSARSWSGRSISKSCGSRAAEAKRLNAAARCMTAYQHGLLTLAKLRQNGNQRITVQYVNVSNGSQAVLGDIVKQGQQG